MLGHRLGGLGNINHQIVSTLANMLGLDTTAANDMSDRTQALTRMVRDTVFNIGEIDIEGMLVYQVRHPAKAFLRSQKVHVVQGEEAMAHQEPLFLDHLTTYQIKDHLIKRLAADKRTDNKVQQDSSTLMYQKIIPAGVARQTTLPNQQQQLQQQCLEFEEQLIANGFGERVVPNISRTDISRTEDMTALHLLTPTAEHPFQIELAAILNRVNSDANSQIDTDAWLTLLPKSIKIKGLVPLLTPRLSVSSDNDDKNAHIQAGMTYAEQSPKQWLNILPNSASPKHLLKFWLSHLYWQVARCTTAEQVAANDGVSIWRFNKSSSKVDAYKNVIAFKLSPIVYEDAVLELIKWAIFGNLSGQTPITLLPEYALNYLAKCSKSQADDNENSSYWPKRADFKDWLRSDDHLDTVYDTCSQHAIWQYVLRDQDAFRALSAALTTLAQPLYRPMFTALDGLDN